MDDLTRIENLTDKQITILNGEIIRNRKSTGVTYLLLIFLGGIGVHKFYLGKTIMGLIYIGFFILGLITAGLGFIVLAVALLIDLFTIPKQIKEHEDKIKGELLARFERQNINRLNN